MKFKVGSNFSIAVLFMSVTLFLGISTVQAQENTVPVLTMSSGSTTFVEDAVAVAIDSSLTLVEPGASSINGATVAITGGYLSNEDRLVYTTTAGISGSFNPATGILTLTGSATAADYQTALRAVQYQNSNSATPNTGVRTIRYALGSSLSFSENGHFYEFVSAPSISWTAAKNAAATRTLYGLQGYLATVTSANENSFIASKLAGQGWMGASDAAVEGDWQWATGPESGTSFWSGLSNGNAVNGEYNNWSGGEPNNAGNEDYAHFLVSGAWNDYPLSLSNIAGYVVEYGGMPSDPTTLQITGNKSINVTAQNDAPSFSADATLSAINEDTLSPTGATISFLLNSNFNDIDASSSFSGIAVAADASVSGVEGDWEYSTDGGSTWFDMGSVSTSSALLLSSSTTLRFKPFANYGGTPGSLTVFAVDESGSTTYTNSATRQVFDTTADDATSTVSASGVSVGTSVSAVNDLPTLTNFTAALDSSAGGIEVELTLAEFQAQGDEADNEDGTVSRFVIKAVSSGSLKIGASSGSASVFSIGSNDTVDAANNVYWTPANNASGEVNAFTVVAEDNDNAESISAIQATVTISSLPLVVYDFEDNTNDSSGNGNHGVLQGTIAYDSAGRSGKALSLSGSGYVELPYDLLRSNQDFTVSLWFKTTSTGGILGYQNATAGTTSANFIPIISINNSGQLQTELWKGSSMLVTSTSTVNDGQWHRVVMTADTTNNALSVYLDGVVIDSATGAIQHLNMSFNQLGLNDSSGRTSMDLPPTTNNYFTGLLDEFTFYSNALPAAEIAKNTQSISFSAIADQSLSQGTLNLAATASSSLTVTYSSATTAVCTVTASTLTLLSTGICTIQANQVGDATYSSAAQIIRDFRVFNSLPPRLTMSSGSTTFVEDGVAVAIDPLLTIVEPSATAIDGATVAITGGYLSTEDRLVYTTTAGISGSFDTATGILTLTGSATPEDYQAVLRAVQYQNINSATPNTEARIIRYALGSSLSFSENGHFYEFVSATGITWTAARDAAAARTLYGLQGYLATVTSVNESSFIASKLVGQGWMGASDAAVEGDWRWVTGPEAGTVFWSGVANGGAVGGEYNNWSSNQPDNSNDEDYGQFLESGIWNDLPLSAGNGLAGYVVEYGGMSGDSTLQVTGNKSISVARVNDVPTGSVNMSGNLIEGATLISDISTIADVDGLTAMSYQWQREGVDIIGAIAANYVLTAADVGRAMTVTMTYTDGGGSFESLSSVASAVIDGDLDGDSIGDATDTDIDGDGLNNAYEMANGLDSRNASDRDIDRDNDGVSNYDEFVAGSNVNRDDYPPVLSIPADISMNAVGLYTAVDLGNASGLDASDGVVMAQVTHLDGERVTVMPTHFSPGVHVITWAASDTANNRVSAMQKINVMPLVEFSKNQVSTEGATASFSVILNGPAVNYPVTVPYTVSGTAMTDGSDHDLVDGSVIINSPDLVATVSFTLVDDGAGEGMETLLVTMGEPTNAVVGPAASHRVDIFEGNVVPVVSLSADQGGNVTRFVSQDDGQVVVTAAVTDANVGDVHFYDWSVTDNVLVDTDSDQATFSFDPADLIPGLYTINVSINDGLSTVNEQLVLNIVASLPALSITDSDGDGVGDATEGYGDSDGDGVPNYLDNSNMASNVAQQRAGEIETFLMETEPGLMLSLGSIAFSAGEAQTGVSDSNIEQYGKTGTGAVTDKNYTFSGGLFDFNVEALPVPGQSVSVVIVQNIPILANAVYRKLMVSGWQEFVEDSNNRLASAPGVEGYCPPPGDSSFSPGLTQGHWCVQLTIEDGGPNDADGRVNQTVQDPGGVAVLSSTPVNVKVTGNGGGGGSMSFWAMLLMGFITAATRCNGRRLILALCCAVSGLSMAHAQSQLIPDYIAINYLSAKSDERASDFQADIDNLGLSATVTQTDLSRSGWSSYLGYQFTDNLALELGYVDLGESTTSFSGLAPDVDAFINSAENVYPVTGSGWTFNFVGRAPLNKKVDILLNFGAFLWQAEYDLSSETMSRTFEEDGFDITLGFGLEMDVVAQVPVRLGWTKYRLGDADVNIWSLGLGYRF